MVRAWSRTMCAANSFTRAFCDCCSASRLLAVSKRSLIVAMRMNSGPVTTSARAPDAAGTAVWFCVPVCPWAACARCCCVWAKAGAAATMAVAAKSMILRFI